MNVIKTPLERLLILEPIIHRDNRGYFLESYNKLALEAHAHYDTAFIQDNQAKSVKNVLRGLHYQNQPAPQAKLIRVLSGSIWDVVVDIRKYSKTYKQWYGIELSAENNRQFLIPHGFAHGYSVLTDTAEIFYKCDNYYNRDAEGGVFYADPELSIDWKINVKDAIISEKDKKQPLLADSWNTFE